MILTKGEEFRAFGVGRAGSTWFPVARLFYRGHMLAVPEIGHPHKSESGATAACGANVRNYLRMEWKVTSVEVFRATLGADGSSFDPFVGFVPLKGDAADKIMAERKQAEVEAEAKRRIEVADREKKAADAKVAANAAE